jgi:hypothetical protein
VSISPWVTMPLPGAAPPSPPLDNPSADFPIERAVRGRSCAPESDVPTGPQHNERPLHFGDGAATFYVNRKTGHDH